MTGAFVLARQVPLARARWAVATRGWIGREESFCQELFPFVRPARLPRLISGDDRRASFIVADCGDAELACRAILLYDGGERASDNEYVRPASDRRSRPTSTQNLISFLSKNFRSDNLLQQPYSPTKARPPELHRTPVPDGGRSGRFFLVEPAFKRPILGRSRASSPTRGGSIIVAVEQVVTERYFLCPYLPER